MTCELPDTGLIVLEKGKCRGWIDLYPVADGIMELATFAIY
jgi:hypothetical protein